MFTDQTRKVIIDMSKMQSSWAAWFVGFAVLAYMVLPIFGIEVFSNNQLGELVTRILSGYWGDGDMGTEAGGFLSFITHPAKIFMLAIGIASISGFLTFYVKQGVTRKTYYIGTISSGIVVSIVIALSAGIVSIIDRVLLATGTDVESNWLLSLIVIAVHIFFYHVVGWLIGVGFYRNGILGFLMIIVAVALAFANESLWGDALTAWTNLTGAMALWVSFAGTIALCIAVIWVLRLMTRKIRIRLK